MGTRPYCLSLLLAVFLGILCVSPGCGKPEVEPDPVLVAVFGAILTDHLPSGARTNGDPYEFVIQRMSTVSDFTFGEDMRPPGFRHTDRVAEAWVGLHGSLDALRRETWDAFRTANAAPQDLSTCVHFSSPVVFLTEAAVDDLFAKGCDEGYMRFFREYPDTQALLALSMPGVSPDGDQALAYVERGRGGLSGSGVYYLLTSEAGVWTVVDQLVAWIA